MSLEDVCEEEEEAEQAALVGDQGEQKRGWKRSERGARTEGKVSISKEEETFE